MTVSGIDGGPNSGEFDQVRRSSLPTTALTRWPNARGPASYIYRVEGIRGVVYRLMIPMNLLAIAWAAYGKWLLAYLGYDTAGLMTIFLMFVGGPVLLVCLSVTTALAYAHRDLTAVEAWAQVTVWVTLFVLGLTFSDDDAESGYPSILAALAGKTVTNEKFASGWIDREYHRSLIDTFCVWSTVTAFLVGCAAWMLLVASLFRDRAR